MKPVILFSGSNIGKIRFAAAINHLLVILTLMFATSSCIVRKPLVKEESVSNSDGTRKVYPEWNVQRTTVGKVSPLYLGFPIGAGIAYGFTQITGVQSSLFNLVSILGAPVGVFAFNRYLLKRSRAKPFNYNRPEPWLRKYNKATNNAFKYAYRKNSSDNFLTLGFSKPGSASGDNQKIPDKIHWKGSAFKLGEDFKSSADLYLMPSTVPHYSHQGYIRFTSQDHFFISSSRSQRMMWVYGNYDASVGKLILHEAFRIDPSTDVLLFSYNHQYMLDVQQGTNKLNGFRRNSSNENNYRFSFKRPKKLSSAQQKRIEVMNPAIGMTIGKDSSMAKGGSGWIIFNVSNNGAIPANNIEILISSAEQNSLTYTHFIGYKPVNIHNNSNKEPLGELGPGKTVSSNFRIYSKYIEKDLVPITVSLFSGSAKLLTKQVNLNLKEDRSLENTSATETEKAVQYFLLDSIFNPLKGQKELEILSDQGSVEASCWLAVFSKLGYIHHPSNLQLTDLALARSAFGDSLEKKALRGSNEALFLLSFIREARNAENRKFDVSDSRSMIQKAFSRKYLPAHWANQISGMNLTGEKMELRDSEMSIAYFYGIRKLSGLNTSGYVSNFGRLKELNEKAYFSQGFDLMKMFHENQFSSAKSRINNMVNSGKDQNTSALPFLCTLIRFNPFLYSDSTKQLLDSIVQEGIISRNASALYISGEKKIQSSSQEISDQGLDQMETSAFLGFKPAIIFLASHLTDKGKAHYNEKKAIHYVEFAKKFGDKSVEMNYDYTKHSWTNIFNNIQIDEYTEVRKTYVNGSLSSADESSSVSILGSVTSTLFNTLLDSWRQSQPNYNYIWSKESGRFTGYQGIVMGSVTTNIKIPAGSLVKISELGTISAGLLKENATPEGFVYAGEEDKKESHLPYMCLMYRVNGIWMRYLPPLSSMDRQITAIAVNEKYTINNIGYYTFSMKVFK